MQMFKGTYIAAAILILAIAAGAQGQRGGNQQGGDSVPREVSSDNREYVVIREKRISKSISGKSKIGTIDILKDKSGKKLWEKHLPGDIEGVDIINGKPVVIVKVYASNRRVKFDQNGNVLKTGDKFSKQIMLKNQFSGWSGVRNPLQIIDNKTGRVLWELASDNITLDSISEDGQYFVILESTLTYKKETIERITQMQKYIKDNESAIKQGKIAEPSSDLSEKDIERHEYYLAFYNINHEVVWKKQIKPLGTATYPCCPTIENRANKIFIILYDQNPDNINERVRRVFDDKGLEGAMEEMGK